MAEQAFQLVALAHSEVTEAEIAALREDGIILDLPGRHGTGQCDQLFTKSGLIGDAALVHHPFLVFVVDPVSQILRVEIVKTVRDLMFYDDQTPVMLQWPGQWRSDWFHFKVIDLREHLKRRAEAP